MTIWAHKGWWECSAAKQDGKNGGVDLEGGVELVEWS